MLDPCPTIPPELSRRVDRPSVSIVASDLSSQGAGRWGGAVRPFLLGQALQRLGYPVEMVGFSAEGDRPSPATDIPLQVIPAEANRLGPQAIRALFHHLSRQPKGNIVYAYKLKPSNFGLALLHRLVPAQPPPDLADSLGQVLTDHPRPAAGFAPDYPALQPHSWEARIETILSHVETQYHPPRAAPG